MKSLLRALAVGARLKTLGAGIVPVWVGSAYAVYDGHTVDVALFTNLLFVVVLIQLATNYFNDALDFYRGADQADRLGPQRLSQSGMLSPRLVLLVGVSCVVLAAASAVPLVVRGGWPIVAIGVLSLFLTYAYTGGPLPLAYRGLGDLFVVLFFGVIPVMGTYYLYTLEWSWHTAVAGLQVGMLATVLIAVNNLRDVDTDRRAQKMTLAARFGVPFARWEIVLLILGAFLMLSHWIYWSPWWAGLLPLGFAGPLAIGIVRKTLTIDPGPACNLLLARAAVVHLLFGLSLGLGFAL